VYQLLGRWLLRILIAFAVFFLMAWIGDWTLFNLGGKPTSTVTVHRFMSIPLKGQKVESDYLGDFAVPCSRSLFPQGGNDPCWYLLRYPNQWEKL
jgi:hypothetical protein